MAAAEARAAWQRANRCFVQEDAKRAPKLATRQSSTLSPKHVDAGPVGATDRLDYPAVGFSPFNGAPYSNLPPDAKWWLQKDLNIEHLNGRDVGAEPEMMENRSQVEPSTISEDSVNNEVVKKHSEFIYEEPNVGGSVSKQPSNISSSADSSWMGGDKVPWWRVTDEEELASFVAHKSLLRVENCDLPPPQKTRVRRDPCKQATSIDHDEIVMRSLGCEAISNPSSDSSQRRHWSSVGELSQNECFRSIDDNTLEKEGISVNDPGHANLLEALCRSQTRARQAEKAAKQAYTEKDDILKLFFRQASQLFAYKQWFKLLQLENLLLQSGKHILSLSSPFPCTSKKPHNVRKTWQKSSKAKKRKRRSYKNDIGKHAVAFAVGFTLVGAGLILGWTVGWLLPTF
ncbi:hypothetical protein RND81_02G133000 [Saponaria officinalis]|uniref:Uncharacterized protein n=1 Tax=Saponaria officinalis TaxID=3572 RepID=A0AAW1ML99_SAPOF